MWGELITVAFLGGVIGLDRRAILQVMISNPLVAATLVGVWLGEPVLGLQVGAVISLLWLYELPVGASVPPDDTLIALVTAFLAVSLTAGGEVTVPAAAMVALLWATPFGILARRLDVAARRWNVAVSRWVIQAPEPAYRRMLLQAQGVGLLTAFTAMTVTVLIGAGSGLLLLPWVLRAIPDRVSIALAVAYATLPLIGVAAGVMTINRRRSWWIVAAIFLVFNVIQGGIIR